MENETNTNIGVTDFRPEYGSPAEAVELYAAGSIRAHAASDIRWAPLIKMILLFFLISTAVSGAVSLITALLINSAGAVAGIIVSLILSVFSLVLTTMLMAGMLKSIICIRRNEPPVGLFGATDRTLPFLGMSCILSLIILGLMAVPSVLIVLLKDTTAGIIIGSLLMLAAMVFAVILMFKYAMAPYFCVDGLKAVASLKASRAKMKGSSGRYFMAILPVFGWFLVMTAALSLTIILPVLSAAASGGVSLPGAVLWGLSLIVLTFAFMIPLVIYAWMIGAEFYDNLLGLPMRDIAEKPNRKPLIINLILGAALTLLTCIFMLLPFARIDLPLTGMHGTGSPNTETAEKDTPAREEPAEEEDYRSVLLGDEDTGGNSVSSDDDSVKIAYDVPEGYELFTEEDDYRYYTNGGHYISLYKSTAYGGDLSYLEGTEGTEKKKIGETEGYLTVTGDEEYKTYTFVFMKGDKVYSISGDNEGDITKLIESVK